MSWNPEQYLKFAQPRLRPALDLLARVPLDDPRNVVDLGCGTGTLTRLLAERWPRADVCGVDTSAAMLAQHGAGAAVPPNVRWLQQDLATWLPDVAPELIGSNAALHWLPDHAQLLPRLLAQLAPGGVLALQMPRNFDAPSHTAIAATVRDGPWRDRLEPMLKPTVAEPAWYVDLLAPLAAELDLWETEYQHLLAGPDPVKEWTKGTWLAPFLDALDAGDEREAFERDYAERVRRAYPQRADGTTLFAFRRLFIVVRRC